MKILKLKYKKIIGWGTGNFAKEYIKDLNLDEDYFIDSNPNRINDYFYNKVIKSPEILKNEDTKSTLIVVYSMFYDDILANIKIYGDFDVIKADIVKIVFGSDNAEVNIKNCISKVMSEKYILSIGRNDYTKFIGGTEKFIKEQENIILLNKIKSIYIFFMEMSLRDEGENYIYVIIDGQIKGPIKTIDFINIMKANKDKNNLIGTIIHNLMSANKESMMRLISNIKNNILYYVHDYYCICKQYNLLHNDKKYCNIIYQGLEVCKSCKYCRDREENYKFFSKIFSNKNLKIIAPSNICKSIVESIYSINPDRIIVLPHQKFELIKSNNKNNKKINIAYVGYKDYKKGWDAFKVICKEFDGKYNFFCAGKSDEKIDNVTYLNVSFQEDGVNCMVDVLKKNKIDIAFLWSIWPETYSYTYYESYAANCFVITYKHSGNICYKVLENNNGQVFNNINELVTFLKEEDKLEKLLLTNKVIPKELKINSDFLDVLKL